jgi:hypothetical protein
MAVLRSRHCQTDHRGSSLGGSHDRGVDGHRCHHGHHNGMLALVELVR